MATIDDLNTQIQDILNRFGCRDPKTDIALYCLCCKVALEVCRQNGHSMPVHHSNAISAICSTCADVCQLRLIIDEHKIGKKMLDDINSSNSRWSNIDELIHFSLYNESGNFLGDADSEIDFWFMSQIITELMPVADDNEQISFAIVVESLFLADALVQWASQIAKTERDTEVAVTAVTSYIQKMGAGMFSGIQDELEIYLPLKNAG